MGGGLADGAGWTCALTTVAEGELGLESRTKPIILSFKSALAAHEGQANPESIINNVRTNTEEGKDVIVEKMFQWKHWY